jgi:uncharacterized protein DUF4440
MNAPSAPPQKKMIDPEVSMKFVPCSAMCALLMVMSACTSERHHPITQEELIRNTREMFDSVAAGDQAPWKKYFAEDSMYFDEKGRSMDKAALINDITPLPKGYSEAIKLVRTKSHVEGNTAILSYDLDETETIFGQNMTARYHGTDTWMYRNGKWQVVAGQIFRYYEDPAPGRVDTRMYAEYAGSYELAPEVTQAVSLEDNKLFAQRTGGDKVLLIPESTDMFYRQGIEGRRLFRRDDRGRVDAMIDRRNNEDVIWKKVKRTGHL